MTKKRAIVSYDKLSIDQKRQLVIAFPDGFSEGMTQIKTPTGETLDALLWDTEDVIYLIKLNKPFGKPIKNVEDDDDEDEQDDFEEVAVDAKDVEDDVADDEEDDYDTKAEDEEEDDED
jgi:hypothetical protein